MSIDIADTIAIEVTVVEPSPGSIWYGEGLDDAGDIIAFLGDARPMAFLREAVEANGTALAFIEPWQRCAVRP